MRKKSQQTLFSCQKGLTLIEVVVSIFLVGVASYLLANFTVLSRTTAKIGNDKNTSMQVAANHMEKAKLHITNEDNRKVITTALQSASSYSFPDTTEHIKGIDYVIRTTFTKPTSNLNLLVYKAVVSWDRTNGVGRDSVYLGSALNYD